MRRMQRLFLFLFLCGGWGLVNWTFARDQFNSSRDYLPGKIVVKFKSDQKKDKINSFRQALTGQLSANYSERVFPETTHSVKQNPFAADLAHVFIFDLPAETDILATSAALKKQPGIAYAEPVYYRHLTAIPNDPLFPSQWYLHAVKAPAGWDISQGDTSVIIAIIDSGMDLDHPDLIDRVWVNTDEIPDNQKDDDGNGYIDDVYGWDFFNKNNNPNPEPDGIDDDKDGLADNTVDHGTGMAGLASATANNAEGIAGVGWSCKLMPLQVFPDDGSAPTNLVAAAIRYAADNGGRVINLSLGSSNASELEHDAIKYAFAAGVALFGSAGNDNVNELRYPGAFPEVLAVAATANLSDLKSSISNYGTFVDVCAPGGDFNLRPASEMISTSYYDPTFGFNQKYSARTKEGYLTAGTSSSAAMVSGLAGLVLAHNPQMTNTELYFQIAETADNIDNKNPDYAGLLGHGRVNAFRALTETVTPRPRLALATVTVLDSLGGNGNRVLDPGETVQIVIAFKNDWADANNLTVTLRTDDYAIVPVQAVVNYPMIPGLTDLSHNLQDNRQSPFEIQIIPESLPHRVKFFLDLNDGRGVFATQELTLPIAPNVLLVDDDDNLNNIESYYLTALDSLGIAFDVWNRSIQGSVGFNRLMNYPVVIWLCEWTFPSLDADDRADLEFYLLAGGNLFLSGQDIGWDLSDGASGNENEFSRSQGLSKQFYETVLHASYIKDDSDFNSVSGIQGNPIGAGLRFTIRQPGRADDQQFPSEILPLDGATSIFNYSNGNSGAILYSGIYRLVYFAFGGYEAIADDQVRFEVMNRVMKWFCGIELEFTEWTDTENITSDYRVEAMVSSAVSPLTQVELYWDTDGLFPFQKVAMTDLGGGKYQAFIPAQKDAQIQYFVFARNQAGFYTPTRLYSFFAGADQKPPTIAQVTVLSDQLSNAGPFPVAFSAEDNIGLDTTYAFVHFFTSATPIDSSRLKFHDQSFSGAIPVRFGVGDTVHYYVSTRDRSSKQNRAQSALFSYQVGREGFENGLGEWARNDSSGWVWDTVPHTGDFNLRWLPRQYQPGQQATVTLKKPIWLAGLEQATLKYWYFHLTRSSDYVVLEASTDSGQTWVELSKRYSGTKINKPTDKYLEELIPLDAFIQAGAEKLWLQIDYVLGAGSPAPANGFYLDDIEILPQSTGIASELIQAELPAQFGLAQNFPNPFNASTRIRYLLPEKIRVTLTIYNLLGQKVRQLINEVQGPGNYAVIWNGLDQAGQMVPSGVYLYQIQAGNYTATRKLLLLK